MSEYQITNQVPIPKRAGKLGKPIVYPFEDMNVGDSFLVTDVRKFDASRNSACKYGQRHNKKFVTSFTDEGVRIWRIA
jgi:hypothetical protein